MYIIIVCCFQYTIIVILLYQNGSKKTIIMTVPENPRNQSENIEFLKGVPGKKLKPAGIVCVYCIVSYL